MKVRGYRIELGEIEAVLGQFDGIAQVVTIVREDVPGDQRLVAYQVASQPEATPREASRSEASALRAHLRKQLPDYMVPQHFVWLPAFTLLPNGKIDRKELPRPDQLHRGDATPPAACCRHPRGPLGRRCHGSRHDRHGRPGGHRRYGCSGFRHASR